MNAEHETQRAVRAWLRGGATHLPNRVRLEVLGGIASTPQDRPWRMPLGSTRPRAARVALLVAALVVLAVAVSVIGRPRAQLPSVGGPTASPSGAPGPAASRFRTALPTRLPGAGPIDAGWYYFLNPHLDDVPGYDCTNGCPAYDRVFFTLPTGWVMTGNLISKHFDQPGEVGFSIWTVGQVYADPCHWQGSPLSKLDIGYPREFPATGPIVPEPDAGGLANQIGRQASPITRVTLAKRQVFRIQLSVPVDLDIASCDRGQYRSWTEWEVFDGANAHHVPGQVDVVYMMDVDRRPFLIDATYRLESTASDRAELDAVLASMFMW